MQVLTSKRGSGKPVYAMVRTPCQLTKNSMGSNMHGAVSATNDSRAPVEIEIFCNGDAVEDCIITVSIVLIKIR